MDPMLSAPHIRLDFYSVAALALELLTGAPPYEFDDVGRGGAATQFDAPPLPSSRGLSLPGLDAVFARGLHSNPRERFSSAGAFVRALTEALCSAAPRDSLARPRLYAETAMSVQERACATAKTLRAFKRGVLDACGRRVNVWP
jgi:serine/threonine-protein kinase